MAARRSGLKVIRIPKRSTDTPKRTTINSKNLRVIKASIKNRWVCRLTGLPVRRLSAPANREVNIFSESLIKSLPML